MLEQLLSKLGAFARNAMSFAAELAHQVWRVVREPIIVVLQFAAALILLFEEWGWRPLVELLGRLSRFALWARLERLIAGLPPYGALAVLALPTSLLLPLKFVAIYLLAQGHAVSAGALFVAAKIASTALIARIFILTKPALMRIGWFAYAYDWLMPWKEALFAEIRASWAWRYGRMVKTRVRLEAKQAWGRWKPRLAVAWDRWRPWLDETRTRWRASAAKAWARTRPRLKYEALRLRIAARQAWARVRGV
jgi:hypothetical protein